MRAILIIAIFVTILSIAVSTVVPSNTICGDHATYITCGPNCDTECARLNQPCNINYIRCPDSCYCDKGYARRELDNVCIPISSC